MGPLSIRMTDLACLYVLISLPRFFPSSGATVFEKLRFEIFRRLPPDVAKIRVGRTAALREGQFFRCGCLAHWGEALTVLRTWVFGASGWQEAARKE